MLALFSYDETTSDRNLIEKLLMFMLLLLYLLTLPEAFVLFMFFTLLGCNPASDAVVDTDVCTKMLYCVWKVLWLLVLVLLFLFRCCGYCF